MGSENPARLRRDCLFNAFRVNHETLGVDVDHHRLATFPHDSRSGRDVTERRGYDLAREVQRLDCNLQGDGSIAGVQQVFYPELSFQLQLELMDERTIICEPRAIP